MPDADPSPVALVADANPTTDAAADPAPASASRRPTRLHRAATRLAWTPRQRRALAVVLAGVLALLCYRMVRDAAFVGDPQPTRPARFDELADRLDPNTAAWQELVAIPTLGEKRARAIVDHRQDWAARHPGEPAYKSATDLAAVKGIGSGMIEALEPHLAFPQPPATTASATRAGSPAPR